MKRTLFVLVLVVSMSLFASCANQNIKGTESSVTQTGDIKMVKITADQVGVKSGCSAAAPDINTVAKNAKLDVLSKVADWYAVKLPNNQIGFVPQQQSTPVVPDGNTATPSGTTVATPGTPAGTAPGGTTDNSTADKTKTPDNTNSNNAALSSMEQEMLNLINQARSQNNAAPLQIDPTLENMARVKAQDMIDNNYFSHNSPKYGSPFDMMKSFGINYVEAGENIAGNQTVQKAHDALMNSPGHRKNILNPNFTHVGIGIRKGGQYGYMFAQDFISQPK